MLPEEFGCFFFLPYKATRYMGGRAPYGGSVSHNNRQNIHHNSNKMLQRNLTFIYCEAGITHRLFIRVRMYGIRVTSVQVIRLNQLLLGCDFSFFAFAWRANRQDEKKDKKRGTKKDGKSASPVKISLKTEQILHVNVHFAIDGQIMRRHVKFGKSATY